MLNKQTNFDMRTKINAILSYQYDQNFSKPVIFPFWTREIDIVYHMADNTDAFNNRKVAKELMSINKVTINGDYIKPNDTMLSWHYILTVWKNKLYDFIVSKPVATTKQKIVYWMREMLWIRYDSDINCILIWYLYFPFKKIIPMYDEYWIENCNVWEIDLSKRRKKKINIKVVSI